MRKFQRAKEPASSAHPVVKWIWREMNRQKASQQDVAQRAGVSASAMRKWRNGSRSPMLMDLEAVVNTLGGKIQVRIRDE